MSSVSAEDVRVVTTIGHVDHGKTTFVDYLLAANNIISSRMAGKVRYLDSREDEQQRGITMESSAVALRFRTEQNAKNGDSVQKTYVINLIDTPGHVDFSGEVSSASRLCDGALLLLDVVEGVCTQTIAVLRQAYMERIRPILVLNKCDRLITELKLSPIEGYHHLTQVIEQVNAIMGSFYAGERMEDDLRWREEREKRLQDRRISQENADALLTSDADVDFHEKDDEDLYFSPERGNVIFASAVDGWGFRIGKFAQLYSEKLGIKEMNLRRVLWGDYYLDPKTKRIIGQRHLKGRALKPLFVQFVLDNIWAVYDGVVMNPNTEKVSKIVSALKLKLNPRDLKSKDTRHLLSLIFGQWLSLSTCTVQAIVDIVQPPSVAQASRMPKMLHPDLGVEVMEPKSNLERDLFTCNPSSASYVVAYVSKMFAVAIKDLPENKRSVATAEELRERGKEARQARESRDTGTHESDGLPGMSDDKESSEPSATGLSAASESDVAILGFARLYCGVLRKGARIHCVLPKYNKALGIDHPRNAGHVLEVKVEALYEMMGRDLEPVSEVSAGKVFALRGLEGRVWRHATLCRPGEGHKSPEEATLESDSDYLINLGGILRQTAPIVRVALEPAEPSQLPQLVKGLKLLSQADPAVETFQQQTGEHVILTAGELHLERCLKDLRERFAKIDIHPSEPIVPFRETAIKATEMTPPRNPKELRGTVRGSSAFSVAQFTIRALPLPMSILEFVQENLLILKKFMKEKRTSEKSSGFESSNDIENEEEDEFMDSVNISGDILKKPTVRPNEFWAALDRRCREAGPEWQNATNHIWAFGPHSAGACLLIDSRQLEHPCSLRDRLSGTEVNRELSRLEQQCEGAIETGFQLATLRGPMCHEPVEGVAYFVEKLEIDTQSPEAENSQVTGSLITAAQDCCRNGLLDWSPRLKLAMYACDIQASTDVLGKVYGVVAKRRGRIVSEEMKEGTSFFTVNALLPVVESFGFADEIRKRTSGAASPQLIFSGYELLDQDPYWVPTTEEELEDLGEKADRENVAKAYVDRVRERKGLSVDKKIVEFAEKQRTLKK